MAVGAAAAVAVDVKACSLETVADTLAGTLLGVVARSCWGQEAAARMWAAWNGTAEQRSIAGASFASTAAAAAACCTDECWLPEDPLLWPPGQPGRV